MSININLVENKNPNEARLQKLRKLRAVSVGILIVTAFLAVILFAVDYRFSASYVKNQEAKLQNELEPFGDTTAKLFIVNTKLNDISKILDKRKKYSIKVNKIAAGNSGLVDIDELEINESGVRMTLSANSISPIDEYLNYLIELAENEELTSITLKRFTADENGYRVELVII